MKIQKCIPSLVFLVHERCCILPSGIPDRNVNLSLWMNGGMRTSDVVAQTDHLNEWEKLLLRKS